MELRCEVCRQQLRFDGNATEVTSLSGARSSNVREPLMANRIPNLRLVSGQRMQCRRLHGSSIDLSKRGRLNRDDEAVCVLMKFIDPEPCAPDGFNRPLIEPASASDATPRWRGEILQPANDSAVHADVLQ